MFPASFKVGTTNANFSHGTSCDEARGSSLSFCIWAPLSDVISLLNIGAYTFAFVESESDFVESEIDFKSYSFEKLIGTRHF